VTCSTYPAYLTDAFPEWRDQIASDLRASAFGADWLLAHSLTRDVLLGGVLRQATDRADDDLLQRWYEAVEVLLASPDGDLEEAILHEIPRNAVRSRMLALQSQARSGPLLAKAIGDHLGNTTWRHKSDWLDEPSREVAHQPSADVYLFRNELVFHGRRFSDGSSSYVITEPFARLPASSEPAAVGAVLAGVLSRLDEQSSEVQDQLTEFLDFVGGVDWRTLYTQSVVVRVEFASPGSEATLWSIRGDQRGDQFATEPLDSPIQANRLNPDRLGASLIAALQRSSTTGWING
jgi:hypothetical protein